MLPTVVADSSNLPYGCKFQLHKSAFPHSRVEQNLINFIITLQYKADFFALHYAITNEIVCKISHSFYSEAPQAVLS